MTIRVYSETSLTPEPWMRDGACATTDPELFFPAHGDRPGAQRAIAVCAGCDVRARCLEYALRTKQRHGVYGGMGMKQRELLRRRTT